MRFANHFECFRRVWADLPQAATASSLARLQALDGDRGCLLSYAADMIQQLSEGLRRLNTADGRLIAIQGTVESLAGDGEGWVARIRPAGVDPAAAPLVYQCDRVVLATGSHPLSADQACAGLGRTHIDLDVALQPEVLGSAIAPQDTVAVLGSSHSAMLVLRTLASLPTPPSRVVNFYRSPLKFAEYLESPGGTGELIRHDNTGLKGEVADWVRRHLADCPPSQSYIDCLGGLVRRIPLGPKEGDVYQAHGAQCTVVIAAVGYARNTPPTITWQGRVLAAERLDYGDKGCLHAGEESLPHLQGFGIAFPQRVLDVDGVTPEAAVGFWKFIRYIDQAVTLQ